MGSIKTESTHAPCDAQSLVVQVWYFDAFAITVFSKYYASMQL